jgi:L-alanine-DL-glutamate epimerase-like enolase superfamily enzyme
VRPFAHLLSRQRCFLLIITEASLLQARVPVPEAPRLLLRLATDSGAAGYAEVAAPDPAGEVAEALESLLPLVVRRDPLERGAVWERLALAVEWPGAPDPTSAALLSALDLDLWSLAGQAAGLPIYALLGGRYLRQVDTYGFHDPERQEQAPPSGGVLVVAEEGPEGPEQAVATVEDLRRRWGDAVPLWVDFREALAEVGAAVPPALRLQATEAFCWLDPFPARCLREYQTLAPQAEVPLGAGSSLTGLRGFLRLLEGKCLDLLALDVRRLGGLTGAQRIAHLAAAYQLPVALRGGRWAPTLLAVAHLACTSGVYLPVARPAEAEPLVPPVEAVDGFLTLPTTPGLGAEVSEEFLEGYAVVSEG